MGKHLYCEKVLRMFIRTIKIPDDVTQKLRCKQFFEMWSEEKQGKEDKNLKDWGICKLEYNRKS